MESREYVYKKITDGFSSPMMAGILSLLVVEDAPLRFNWRKINSSPYL